MYLLDYSLDNLSLMAITISVGFVVDDAIVVIENVYRYIEQGQSSMQAALNGARQIGFTVISISTSLVAVFIPLLFMGGLIGRLFHEFAVTLSLAIVVSGVVPSTLTPMMCSRFRKPESAYGEPGRFYRVCEGGFHWMLRHYETGLKWVLRHQGFMLAVWVATFIITVWLYITVPKGFFPQQDTGTLFGQTQAGEDVSFATMARLQAQAAQIVLADPAVASLGSFIGASGGNSTLNNGRMFIMLKPKSQRKITADQVIGRLRSKMASLPGIYLICQSIQDIRVGGRFTGAQYQYSLTSTDLSALNYWSAQLLARLRKIPQLRDVNSDQLTHGLEANVVIDRDAASRLGVSPQSIDNTLYDAFGQRQVATIYEQYNEHYVVLEVDPKDQLEPSALNKIYVKSNTGRMVPLASVARFETGNTSLSVNHQGQFPAVTLSFNLAPGVALGQATEIIENVARQMRMPENVMGSFQGTAQVFQASLATLPLLLVAALITVYIVLGMLYESLIHPITILSTLPSAGVGALVALMFCGVDLSLVSFIGIILLMGIVKKNAIMMIDFALDAERTEGLSPEEVHLQGLRDSLPADHDDHHGGDARRRSAGHWTRNGLGAAPAAGHFCCRRSAVLPGPHALHDAGHLSRVRAHAAAFQAAPSPEGPGTRARAVEARGTSSGLALDHEIGHEYARHREILMKKIIRSLGLFVLLTTPLAPLNLFAQGDHESPLHDQMEGMNHALRLVNRQYTDLTQKASTLALVAEMQKHAETAKTLTPPKADKMSGRPANQYLSRFTVIWIN